MTRDEAYSILSDLIFKGFLVTSLNIGTHSLVFKTVNNKELDLIKILSGSPDKESYNGIFNTYFLALSLLFVNGRNVLVNRHERIPELFEMFRKIPASLFREIFEKLNALRTETLLSIKFLEGFCYTGLSRRIWNANGSFILNQDTFTGIPGTSVLGLNVLQESWISINKMLDLEDEYERQFSLALLIASASNPKGSQKLQSRHMGQIRNLKERREKLAKEGYIDASSKWSASGWAAPVDTVEELIAELERQMHGVKDKHDLFIEDYMKRLKAEAEKKAREAEARAKRLEEGMEDIFITSVQRQLQPEEISKLAKGPRTVIKTVSDDHISAETREKFISKISNHVLSAEDVKG